MATSSALHRATATESLVQLLAEGARLRAAGNGVGALEVYRRALALDPDNAEAIRNFGLMACCLRRFAEAEPYVRRAIADAPADHAYRTGIAGIHMTVAAMYMSSGDSRNAITHLRQAIAYDPMFPEAQNNLALLVHLSGRRGEAADFAPGVAPESFGRHILVACMPKSGSSFLSAALCAATGWPTLPMTYGYLQNEQDIHLPFLLARLEASTVTQQHCRATVPNVQILQAFGIRPIVLVRNLFDVVLSLADFYDTGADMNTFFSGRWGALAPDRKHDLIVDHVMPWYVTFFASWMDVIQAGRLDARLVTYEDMIADKPGTLAAILAHQGLTKSLEECAAAIATVDGDVARTRLNKGVGGRGVAALTEAQKDRVRRLAGYYSDIDFSIVGL